MGPVFRNEVDHQGKAYQDSWDPEGVGRLVQKARTTCHRLNPDHGLGNFSGLPRFLRNSLVWMYKQF
jgi:hypothetical protein